MPLADDLLGLLATRAREEVTHLVPGLGGRIFVRELTPRARAEWLSTNQKHPETSDARLVIACLIDEQGEPVFTQRHLAALGAGEVGSALLIRLAHAAARVSGLLWREEDSLNGRPTISPSTGPPPVGD